MSGAEPEPSGGDSAPAFTFTPADPAPDTAPVPAAEPTGAPSPPGVVLSPAAEAALTTLGAASNDFLATCRAQAEVFERAQAEQEAAHVARMAEVEQKIAAAKAKQVTALAETRAGASQLESEKSQLEGTYKFTKQKVKLDVGGKRVSTGRQTLTKTAPESLLAAMFSGSYELKPDETDGSFFIDRDGTHFDEVMKFLRSPTEFEPPTDPAVLEGVLRDAVFFKVTALEALIRPLIETQHHSAQSQPKRRQYPQYG